VTPKSAAGSNRPSYQSIPSIWLTGSLALTIICILGFVYFPLLKYSFGQWLKPDYSHGFLVPVFAGYLAWTRRNRAPTQLQWPDVWGIAFVVVGAVLFLLAGLSNIAREWLQGVSLILNLCGATLILGGKRSFLWLWPCLAFLVFMFPLPYRVEHLLGWQLQRVAASGSEYALQTIGYPTFREGIKIHCQDHILEVENACNGLSMLLTFIALSVAMAMVVRRPWLDRGLILLSAVPIAIFSNILRIAATGVLYNEAGKELGDKVFHDFAGWMMMPLALGLLLLELKVLDWVLLEDLGKASREDVIRMGVKPAHLFMTSFEANGTKPTAAPPVSNPLTSPRPPRGSGR